MESDFLTQDKDGLKLAVRLTPKSSRCAVLGVFVDADGKTYLKISVNAVPSDGKANQALIAYLAKILDMPKSSILLFSGFSDRRKIVLLKGDKEKIKGAIWQML